MAGKFVLSKTSNDKFHFVLKARNGEVILQSQMHAERADAESAIEAVRTSAADAARFEKSLSKRGEPYFSLTSAGGQIIGMSEMYSSERARDNGIESVRNNAPDAKFEDNTASG
ncbi:MAG: YegP family protein [Burkholderiaceae bacterium]